MSKILTRLVAYADDIGVQPKDLNEDVLGVARTMAQHINDAGMPAQIGFLLERIPQEDFIERLLQDTISVP